MQKRGIVKVCALAGAGLGVAVAIFLAIITLPDMDTVVIVPTFTAAAYQPGGFYDHFNGRCDSSCLTVPVDLKESTYLTDYGGSRSGLETLAWLGIRSTVTDEQVTEDPEILRVYKRVIVLHNEYVSQAEYEAITRHPNVVYLYPNSLYGLVSFDAAARTITLERGHGHAGVDYAFGYLPMADTKNEYDNDCKNWQWQPAANGKILTCYPEHAIKKDVFMWTAIKSLEKA